MVSLRGAARILPLLVALHADARGTLWNRYYLSPVDRATRVYDVYTPTGYDGARKLPAILCLHGRGGSRSSFETAGYQSAADAQGVVLVFWQGRYQPDIAAYSTQYVDGANGIPDETDVLACLDDALAAFAIDPDRVHLAGFSQGGKGALLIGLKNAARFASIVEGAGPSDAWQGQLWSPGFPDFAAAAGGPAAGAHGETLALWYAQSARFLLPNARNIPIALFHGTADTVVPDSTALFPYRNTHHIADTPGFSDERGPAPTLAELHAADPDGYSFTATYPAGIGHDEETLLTPAALFGFVAGKSRPFRPLRVVATTYEAAGKDFYWLRLERTAAPDGTPVTISADLGAQSVRLAAGGDPSVTLDCAAAGLDPAHAITLTIDSGATVRLRLHGAFPAGVRVTLDGIVLPGASVARDGPDILFALGPSPATTILVEPPPAGPIAEGDLLVPALVDSPGRNGARFRTEIVLANLSTSPATLEALLASSPAPPVAITLPANATLRLRSADLFAAFGLASGAAPLRLRVLSGDPLRIFASARVFNDTGAGTYGLSFPVATAQSSALLAGDEATFFGGTPGHPSRTNLSLFAPFEAATAVVALLAPDGGAAGSRTVSLAPLERLQLDDLLAGLPPPARIAVTIVSGRVQAYATVIDNAATNDPFRSPPLLRPLAASRFTIPAVASAPGKNGARFTSDLYLAAPSATSTAAIPVTLTYVPSSGGAPLFAAASLSPGAARVFEDVVASFFPGALPGAGALLLEAGPAIQAFAVTRADSPAGPASQDLPAVREGDEITPSTPAVFAGLAESASARSNLVLTNRGEAAVIDLTLVAEDGPRGTLEVSLGAGEVRQLNSVLAFFGGAPVEAGALLVAPRSGRVVATAVRIDNLTNDPAGLAPLPASALAR